VARDARGPGSRASDPSQSERPGRRRYTGGGIKKNSLPTFFNNWSRVAWGDLLADLPDKDAADLADDAPARETFRRLVREATLIEVVLGDVIGDNGPTQTERRSLIDWCARFAKAGPWRTVRSKKCWCKLREMRGGEVQLRVAIRHELFSQLRPDRRLCEMGASTFARRAARYEVSASTRDDRPHGQAAIVLDAEFVNDLVAGLPDEVGDVARPDAPLER
jgi:hypothetical protein